MRDYQYGKFSQWWLLPEKIRKRWAPLRTITTKCFEKGLVVHILPETMKDVSEAGYPWGGPAVYVRWTKHLAMTIPIAYGLPSSGYGRFAGDIHELGHAVRFLLIGGLELWAKIRPLYNEASRDGKFLDAYSASNIEEFFAQAFEAWWTQDSTNVDHMDPWAIDWGRGQLLKRHPALYRYMREKMIELNGNDLGFVV